MPHSLDINSDQFVELLGEALRAGPASPQWHQAVQVLRAQAGGEGDDYRLLVAAREHLESGRDFRSVRAGPGFTRRLLEQLDQERPRRPWPLATVLAVGSMGLAGLAIAVVGYLLLRGDDPAPPALETLARMQFVRPVESADFQRQIPAQWYEIGGWRVHADGGLKLLGPGQQGYGGGVVWSETLPADQPFALEATIRAENSLGQAVVQVFVADYTNFGSRATSGGNELVWSVQQDEARVILPQQEFAGQAVPFRPPGELVVRLRLDARHVIVETAGERHFAGLHHLAPDRPRHIGARLLSSGDDPADHLTVQSLLVLKP